MKPKYSVPTTTATGTRTTTLSQFLDLRSSGKKQHNSPDSCEKNRPTIICTMQMLLYARVRTRAESIN